MNARQPTPNSSTADQAPASVDIHDRVAEAYHGKLGPLFMRQTQDRIHWICRQVRGESVLDVGCSQGIASILLARESRRVVGIDISARAIDEATTMWRTEPSVVRERLQFVHCDFLSYRPNGPVIDTIVMSEVLEHLVQPERFIERAAELLSPGGTLVVTVPFGINDFIDHKQTFYLAKPYRLISRYFDVAETAILGKWLGIAATKRSSAHPAGIAIAYSEAQVHTLESGFFQLERSLSDTLLDVRAKLDNANLKYRDATSQIATLKQKLAYEEGERAKAVEALGHAEERFAAEMSAVRTRLDSQEQQSREQTAFVRQAELDAQRMDVELEFMRQRVKDSDDRWRSADAQVQDLSRKLVEIERQRDATNQQCTDLMRQLAASLQARDKECDALRREIGTLAEIGRSVTEARHEAEKAAIRLEVERGMLVERLSELENRYRLIEQEANRYREELEQERASSIDAARRLSESENLREQAWTENEERLAAAHNTLAQRDQLLADWETRYARLQEEFDAMARELARRERLQQELESSKAILTAQIEEALRSRDARVALVQREAQQNLEDAFNTIRRLETELRAEKQTTASRALIEEQKEKTRIDELRRELEIAQQKRAGHYAKLQYEIDKNKKLTKRIKILEGELNRINSSLTWDVGHAIVQTKSALGLLTLPARLWKANRRYREKIARKRAAMSLAGLGMHAAKSSELPVGAEERHPSSAPPTVALQKLPTQAQPKIPPETPAVQVISNDVDLSVLGWPSPPRHAPVTAMTVFDEFSRECFAPYLNLIEPRPDNWQGLLQRDAPELLIVESAWRGNGSSWQYRVGSYANPPGNELAAMVGAFKAADIPTVFWNKEDPVHFNNFAGAAGQFDYIFTTAEEAIPRYKDRCAAVVNVLPFACEPGLHNPIRSTERNGKICFAGSYYANRFADRRNDQLMLLDAAAKYPFDIYDRNYVENAAGDFSFPERYKAFVRGSLPYDEMSRAYKNYSVFLNVNSVVDSKTMFSRRVFELLACGTPIVSTRSVGIDEMFGKDLIFTVENAAEADEAIRTLLESPLEWRRRSIKGIRAVFSRHTFAHRTQQILDVIGIHKQVVPEFRLLIYACVDTVSEATRVVDMFSKQDVLVAAKRLVLFSSNKAIKDFSRQDVIVDDSKDPLDDRVGRVVRQFDATHFGSFAPNAMYGKWYLQDLLHGFTYSGADIVGKSKNGRDEYKFDVNIDPSAWLKRIPGDDGRAVIPTGTIFNRAKNDVRTFVVDYANYISDISSMSEPEIRRRVHEVEC